MKSRACILILRVTKRIHSIFDEDLPLRRGCWDISALASHGKSQGLESFSSSATLTFETPAGGLYCLEVFYINFDGNVKKTSIFIILELYGPLNVKPRKYFYKVLAPHKVRSSSGLINL